MARYWVGGTGNWSSTAHWSTASGGATGAAVPTSADDVIVDVNSFSGAGQSISVDTAAVCASLTYSGVTQTGNLFFIQGTRSLTVSGTMAITGHSISDRLYLGSNVRGQSRPCSAGTWGTLANMDFEDIAVTGPGMANTNDVGDCGGNSGTFVGRTPRTLYWFKDTGNYSNTALWSNSTGVADAATIPLPQDTARFDANSFSASGKSVTFDVNRRAGCDWTGTTNTPSRNLSVTQSIYGSEIYVAGMVLNGNQITTMSGRGTHSLATAGLQFPVSQGLVIDCITGTYNLVGTLRGPGAQQLSTITGTFNTNDNLIVVQGWQNGSGTFLPFSCVLNLGRSIIITTSPSNNPMNLAGGSNSTATGLTVNGANATWIMAASGTTQLRCGQSGSTPVQLGRIRFVGSGTIKFQTNGSAPLQFALDTVPAGCTLQFNAGSTYNLTDWQAQGRPGSLVTLNTNSAGVVANFVNVNKQAFVGDYLSLQDIHADVAGLWYAGANSTNVSGNTNWLFTGHRRGASGRIVVAQGTRTAVAQGTRTPLQPQSAIMQSLLTGLQDYWPLGEPSGPRQDAASYRPLLDAGAAHVNSVAGLQGQRAADFTAGVSAQLLRNNASDLLLASTSFEFTIWCYFTSKVASFSEPCLLSNWGGGGYFLGWAHNQDRLYWQVGTSGSTVQMLANTFGAVPANTWLFVDAWFDLPTLTIGLAVNNGAFDTAVTSAVVVSPGAKFEIGNLSTFTNLAFLGYLQLCSLHTKVLTAAERTALYNGGNGLVLLPNQTRQLAPV